VLRVDEAAAVPRISRSRAYEEVAAPTAHRELSLYGSGQAVTLTGVVVDPAPCESVG